MTKVIRDRINMCLSIGIDYCDNVIHSMVYILYDKIIQGLVQTINYTAVITAYAVMTIEDCWTIIL